ncbi:Na/Pi cotransporter family protein [Paenactinomyces guangxiensis]|uniref:Na/Pi cotransporter family protein n=1 Tax=Paenactinomyces guangxiensis TaxID=1490290 RepID=A0A7W2A735_9BACL|nr:Na/Pi symporter [Paenactinomyces guangxiensis]MBA4493145.1 Na/Pi cotransporter family protein [Paenactinomyces guangxiensis]MBH8590005.1 Na/Pi cotransporter family protein [Paenactinomyces guangxiensis]
MKDIIIPFATGLTIFMFGLQLMRNGLERLAQDRLREGLVKFTRTPVRGFFTGIVSTAFLQSSSAVTVLTISFVNAGILTFAQSIGIILGTNIGTTVTTQILALNVEDFAIPLIIAGAVLRILPFNNMAQLGLVIGGFGCIFLGMETMQWITVPLKERGWISWLLENGGNPIWTGIAVGTLLAAMIHSSSACIAITMGFYASGVVSLPFAIAVVFGSNIGTCVTALLAVINTNTAAKQVALSHLVLNIAGVGIFAPLIPYISEYAPVLSTDAAAQIAHIQTLFNIICSVIVLPFSEAFARGIIFLIPNKAATWK